MKITIFGLAWSGTSTIWKKLSSYLNYTFMSSWNIMRKWASQKGFSIYEFEDKIIKKDPSFDLKLDKKTQKFWEENDNFVFESRLARYFIKDSFKIYLYCDENQRYERISSREWLTINQIEKKTKKREDELIKRYSEVYPNINFPPKKEEFDIFIDSTNINPDEIISLIISSIKID